jgi:hypothetical protein
LGSVSSLVSEKKIFEISANHSILLALAAMLDPMGKCLNMNIMRCGVNVNETTTPKSNCIRNAFFSETINQTTAGRTFLKPLGQLKPKLFQECSFDGPLQI